MQEDDYRGDFQNPASMNRYVYVGNNPVMRVDPSGYWAAPMMIECGPPVYYAPKPAPPKPKPKVNPPVNLIDGGTAKERNDLSGYIAEQIGYTQQKTVLVQKIKYSLKLIKV